MVRLAKFFSQARTIGIVNNDNAHPMGQGKQTPLGLKVILEHVMIVQMILRQVGEDHPAKSMPSAI